MKRKRIYMSNLDDIWATATQRIEEDTQRQLDIQHIEADNRLRLWCLEYSTAEKWNKQISADADKYHSIARNPLVHDLLEIAWDALISNYPDAKDVPRHDMLTFSARLWDVKLLTFTDQKTGLMWTKNGNVFNEKMVWMITNCWVETLEYCGYRDWRLPTVAELKYFAKQGGKYRPVDWFNSKGFNNVQVSRYWCGSLNNTDYCDDDSADVISMRTSKVSTCRADRANYVWPVRDNV